MYVCRKKHMRVVDKGTQSRMCHNSMLSARVVVHVVVRGDERNDMT